MRKFYAVAWREFSFIIFCIFFPFIKCLVVDLSNPFMNDYLLGKDSLLFRLFTGELFIFLSLPLIFSVTKLSLERQIFVISAKSIQSQTSPKTWTWWVFEGQCHHSNFFSTLLLLAACYCFHAFFYCLFVEAVYVCNTSIMLIGNCLEVNRRESIHHIWMSPGPATRMDKGQKEASLN